MTQKIRENNPYCYFIFLLFDDELSYLNSTRSIIFTNGTEEARLASISKEREQTKSRSSLLTTQIQQLESFYPAEPEHQVRVCEYSLLYLMIHKLLLVISLC